MKIVILHGDNLAKVAQRLTKFIDTARQRGWKIERSSNYINLNLQELLGSTSLFEETKLIILDDIKKIKKTDLAWLKKNHRKLDGTLIIVNNGLLTKSAVSTFPKADKIEVFELPKLIWAFLDSFYPGNSKQSLKLLHDVLDKEAIELIFYFLVRRLRDLYLAPNPEKMNIPAWRASKLLAQAKRFTKIQLIEIISVLANADYEAKTGEGDLTRALDVVIATKLE